MAPNFCPSCGTKVTPQQKFCHDCGVLLTAASTNVVTTDSAQFSTAPSSTVRPRAHSAARGLGIIGGAIGAFIGVLLLAVLFSYNIPLYYAGYYSENAGSGLLLLVLACIGILGFSIVGALGAAQKLDARRTVNAGALFLAGVVVLLILLSMAILGASGDTINFSISAVFGSAGLVISVLFFLSGFLLLRKPSSK